MVSNLPEEFCSFSENCSNLRPVFRDARRSLDDVSSAKLFSDDEDLSEYSFSPSTLQQLDRVINGHPAVVIFGQTCIDKAKLVNALLEQRVLPTCGGEWRWVRIGYGDTRRVSLTIGSEFELVEKLQSHVEAWTTIPEVDLKRPESERLLLEPSIMLEIRICHRLLEEQVELVVPPDSDAFQSSRLQEILQKGLDDFLPVFLYSMGSDFLNEQNLKELQVIKKLFPLSPVFFIKLANVSTDGSSGSRHHPLRESESELGSLLITERKNLTLPTLESQLISLGYIGLGDKETVSDKRLCTNREIIVSSEYRNGVDKLKDFVPFVRSCFQAELIFATTALQEVLSRLVRKCVLSAFDMAREIQITPRRIQYAQEKEEELYKSLMAIADEKQEEISDLIEKTLSEMKEGLVERAATFRSEGETEEAESSQAVQAATAEIQHLVLSRLSSAVAEQLVASVDCLQDTFVGTLQRCLESLEKNFEADAASNAVKQILGSAYNVELRWPCVHSLVARLRDLLRSVAVPWACTPRLDAGWRRRAATAALDSLPPRRLASGIARQFHQRLDTSHAAFVLALRDLRERHAGRLEQTHEHRLAIRKLHAPRLARLLLETTSMSDKIHHGIPALGKEIGRGQYGVVFACESWAGAGPCAVKSVVPPDDKHWNDLAMEFYYTRTIPEHKRIVRLRGSVVDYTYGGDRTPAVFLVMDRLPRDLYSGLRAGLKWLTRLQIAIDVVEGIRYLHSQGLLHRDIKLKNVLLDTENRGKLTDLGFCIPEALMSGSVVGTPVHMAPELLSGHYDSSVDVYAFGILFWYICAGHVKLPYIFEQFQNKEQLWVSVKRGIRPERLHYFDDRCWTLMEQCWSGDPLKRPLLGDVQPLLESINELYKDKANISAILKVDSPS